MAIDKFDYVETVDDTRFEEILQNPPLTYVGLFVYNYDKSKIDEEGYNRKIRRMKIMNHKLEVDAKYGNSKYPNITFYLASPESKYNQKKYDRQLLIFKNKNLIKTAYEDIVTNARKFVPFLRHLEE